MMGSITTSPAVTVSGLVNDVVVGTVNDQQATVKVNNLTAQVANRSFLATSVPLELGSNTIQATALDRVGNAAAMTIRVTRREPTEPLVRVVSGNNQTGSVGTVLAAPLVAELRDASNQPVVGVPVVFRVTENSGGLLNGSGTVAAMAVTSNAQGRATVQYQVGSRSGVGNNVVEANALGFTGPAIFTASATPTAARRIVVDTGNSQTGAVGQPLPLPFVAIVTDETFNRLGGVSVTFRVRQGGGTFAGQTSVTVRSDGDGRVAAALRLGTQEGQDSQIVDATFTGNEGLPATFVASAQVPGDPSATQVTGVVLDNSNLPILGVTMRLFRTHHGVGLPEQVVPPVQTDEQGQFVIHPSPVGAFKLMADGATVAPARGTFPAVEYDIVTVAGQNTTVGMPVYLPVLDTVNKLCVSETTGGTLLLPQVPGFSLTVAPGSATFPGGARSGCVTVSTVNGDKVPMTPGFGQQPRFIITIQPVGTLFNPPAPITMPNVDGLLPGQVTELYSYDHDLAAFTAIGTGTVTEEGLLIRSDPGVGILKAGWHCGGTPNSTGSAASLSVSFAQPEYFVVVDGTKSVTANGRPPIDGEYINWVVDDPNILELTTTPGCPNQPSCSATVKGKAPGTTQVRVTFICRTTQQQVTASATVKVVKIKNVTFKNSLMSAFKAIDQPYRSVGTYSGKTIKFSFETEPPNATVPTSEIQWSGAASGSTQEVDVTFSTQTNTSVTVTVAGLQRTGAVRVIDRPTGIGENAYALLNPIDTAVALNNNLIGTNASTLEPFTWALGQYPGTQHNTVADAARHTYWNCALAVIVNPGYAAGLTFQHEVSSVGPATETIMDLTNNAAGRAVASGLSGASRSLVGCRAGVVSAVAAGTSTIYLDSSYGSTNTSENALLQPTNR